MAKATVRPEPTDADAVFEDIRRLYRQLQALPCHEKPEASKSRGHQSPAYLALEAQIKAQAERYITLVEEELEQYTTNEDRQARGVNLGDPLVGDPASTILVARAVLPDAVRLGQRAEPQPALAARGLKRRALPQLKVDDPGDDHAAR
jgi:hypothetical protein